VSDETAPLVISIIRGDPTPEELAAVVAVLGSLRSGSATERTRQESQWAAYWRGVRAPLAPGPGSWRQSARAL
jgi:Acyl-CoA carboxylase epsilon subunit